MPRCWRRRRVLCIDCDYWSCFAKFEAFPQNFLVAKRSKVLYANRRGCCIQQWKGNVATCASLGIKAGSLIRFELRDGELVVKPLMSTYYGMELGNVEPEKEPDRNLLADEDLHQLKML